VRLFSLRAGILAVPLLAALAAGTTLAEASIHTLTNGNASVVIDPNTSQGAYDWTVDGVQHLSQQWYWLRIGSGPEVPLSSLSLGVESGGSNQLRLDYSGAVGGVLLQVELTYTLAGGGAGSGQSQIYEEMRISAPLERSDVAVHVFRYADLDLGEASVGDRAEWLPPATIRQFKDQWSVEAVATPAPSHFGMALFPGILAVLDDGSSTTLADSPATLGPGDLTFAVQWDLPLPTRSTASASHTMRLVPVADLSISKTDGQATASPGQALSYTIVAGNEGPNAVTGATVTDSVPPGLTAVTWTCVGANGGACATGGAGNINDTVNLPIGGTVTYTLMGTVGANPSHLRNTATVSVSSGMADPNPSNNSATDDDTLLCFGEKVVVPDGRVTSSTIADGVTEWFAAALQIGNSYSLELKNTSGDNTPPGTLTMFSGVDGCSGTSTMSPRDTTAIDPGAGAARRVSFTAMGTEPFFRARLVNDSGGMVRLSLSWSDTTLYSPAWSTNGSFDAFYSFENTTGANLGGTLTLLDTTGVVLATFPLSIPAGQTASANTASLGVTRNRTGTARFTHDGPPGAVVAEAAIANFSINPAYVQPVKFQAVREAR
jgi:uncharacterized repeat protein (TIGR01451 family)